MFAQVALPVPLKNLFTYQIPDALLAGCRPGCLVLAPVGRATHVGVVWTVTTEPAWREGEIRLLLDLLSDEPLLDDPLRQLLDWMARYYLQPIGSVVATALPRGMGFDRHRRYAWVGKEGGETALPAALQPLAAALRARKGGLSEETLAKRFGRAGLQGRLRQLIARGMVSVAEGWRPRHRVAAAPVEAPEADSTDRAPTNTSGADSTDRAPTNTSGADSIDPAPMLVETPATLPTTGVDPDAAGSCCLPSARSGIETGPALNPGQRVCVEALTAALATGSYAPFLLEGVTGSGKTLVYFHAVAACLRQGRQALLLVPEIALTSQLIARYRARFAERLAILHSGMRDSKRFACWQEIRQGRAPVVIGARSALFAPFARLGLIVVDEEHDGSYKQEEGVCYHARDMAVVRGRAAGAVLILGSATPSLESLANVERGRFRPLFLPDRATGMALPRMEVIDLKDASVRADATPGRLLSGPLCRAIAAEVEAGRQVLLFLNRRGYAPSLLCRRCGAVVTCPNCSVALTLHKQRRRLLCHYCDHVQPIADICATCGQLSLFMLGFGTEQLEEETRALFPNVSVARLDRDTAGSGRLEEILEAFRVGTIQILVGTQMVAKGHHFPNLSLVGVVLAETTLWQPDFRSAERTFQLVTQVAGRAGREAVPGRVMIQTYDPAHYALQAAVGGDLHRFVAVERKFRHEAGYPPFKRLILIRFSTLNQEEGERLRLQLRVVAAEERAAIVLGPAPAPLFKLRGWYRWQVLLKEIEGGALHAAAGRLLARAGALAVGRMRLEVDVDPYSFF
ncbi:MAG: primosomal protein N' [Magnetococcales bacterium]|nr:primosomal protein N' [Magnetococcales bacterium]